MTIDDVCLAGLAVVRHEMRSLENRLVLKLGGLMTTLFDIATPGLTLLGRSRYRGRKVGWNA